MTPCTGLQTGGAWAEWSKWLKQLESKGEGRRRGPRIVSFISGNVVPRWINSSGASSKQFNLHKLTATCLARSADGRRFEAAEHRAAVCPGLACMCARGDTTATTFGTRDSSSEGESGKRTEDVGNCASERKRSLEEGESVSEIYEATNKKRSWSATWYLGSGRSGITDDETDLIDSDWIVRVTLPSYLPFG